MGMWDVDGASGGDTYSEDMGGGTTTMDTGTATSATTSGAGASGAGYGGYASLASMAIGTGVSAYAQYESGKFNRKIQDYNAGVARLKAGIALNQGDWQAWRQGLKTRSMLSAQTAGYAGQGVVVGEGSSAAVAKSTQAMSDLDLATIKNNAALTAWGFQSEAASDNLQGRLDQMGGNMGAAGTILSGGSNAAMLQWQIDNGITRRGGFGGGMRYGGG